MANVLIVDDNADTCRVLSAFLTRAGHQPTCAASVSAAMEAIADRVPDLIITDLMMPFESGYDLLKMVRRSAQTKETPVIVYSAVSEHGYVDQAMESGATDYWLKGSIRGPEISDRLRAYLPATGWAEPPEAHPMGSWTSA
jgi:PleD family two-component response regulator